MAYCDSQSKESLMGDEVVEARNKLDDALNEVFERADEKHLNEGTRNSSLNTPSKRGNTGKGPRKKKRKDFHEEEQILPDMQPSYVVKIFDRQVDLSRFNENNSLYYMIREWMENKPYTFKTFDVNDENFKDELEHEEKLKNTNYDSGQGEFVYNLPKPKNSNFSVFPTPLPAVEKNASIEDVIGKDFDIDELKRDNINRWKKVKNVWKQHSFQTQRLHMESLKFLKDIMTSSHK